MTLPFKISHQICTKPATSWLIELTSGNYDFNLNQTKEFLTMTFEWDGITKSEALQGDELKVRLKLADAAKSYNWKKTVKILQNRPDLINVTRPDGRSLYTPLHQAAHGNAPAEIVRTMIAMGAWRTLKNANGDRPVDIARNKKHQYLVHLLEPVYKTKCSREKLRKIQKHFHEIILSRTKDLIEQSGLILPELEPLLEIDEPTMWFPVPGMYGGFNYWLEGTGENIKLIAESWCRVASGLGQRHEITSEGGKLVEEGFA